jgi:hypothetical protein
MHFFAKIRKTCENGLIFVRFSRKFCKSFQKISRNLSEQMCSNVSIQLSLGLNFRFLVFAKVFVFSQTNGKKFCNSFRKNLCSKIAENSGNINDVNYWGLLNKIE